MLCLRCLRCLGRKPVSPTHSFTEGASAESARQDTNPLHCHSANMPASHTLSSTSAPQEVAVYPTHSFTLGEANSASAGQGTKPLHCHLSKAAHTFSSTNEREEEAIAGREAQPDVGWASAYVRVESSSEGGGDCIAPLVYKGKTLLISPAPEEVKTFTNVPSKCESCCGVISIP